MDQNHDFAFRMGFLQAVRAGLPENEWEDCAAGFRLVMLLKHGSSDSLNLLCLQSPALVTYCAGKYALDYRRKYYRHLELLGLGATDEEGDFTKWEIPERDELPVAALIRIAFWEEITKAATSLSLSEESLFYLLRRFRQEESYAEIARVAGKKTNTIEQSVSRTLKRLHSYFQEQGIDYEHFHDYFVIPPPPTYVYVHVHAKAMTRTEKKFQKCPISCQVLMSNYNINV